MPSAFLALSQPSDTAAPTFFNGPSVKLSVNNMNAARHSPLLRMKNGKSFRGTGPAT